jgi:ketosteroid isomerase-like protein
MSSTEEVLKRHQKTFGGGDLEGVLADYAPDAAFFNPNGVVKGADALRAAFTEILAEWSKPGATFSMTRESVEGNFAYMAWTAETADNVYETGCDAFVVENGKITAHFFSGKITPKR